MTKYTPAVAVIHSAQVNKTRLTLAHIYTIITPLVMNSSNSSHQVVLWLTVEQHYIWRRYHNLAFFTTTLGF